MLRNLSRIFDEAKRLLTKIRLGVCQWFGKRIGVAPIDTDYSSGARCSFGVTLSGGEFTPGGTYPQNYSYPTSQSIDYYASIGMKVIRFPIMWERVQPVPLGNLNGAEIALFEPAIQYAISKGMTVALDVHNNGLGYGAIIGSRACPDSWFADLWGRLAERYKGFGVQMMFMLMSEPSQQCEYQWRNSANAAIAAIRKSGATQTIVVPGTCFDGGWLWTISANARAMTGIKDPLNNYVFEAHQYLNADGSGSDGSIVRPSIGADRLHQMTLWARKNGHRLFLGEFGTGSDAASLKALDQMLRYIAHNADVWQHACWWGAGGLWMNYFMSIEPTEYLNPVDAPQTTLIRKAIAGR